MQNEIIKVPYLLNRNNLNSIGKIHENNHNTNNLSPDRLTQKKNITKVPYGLTTINLNPDRIYAKNN